MGLFNKLFGGSNSGGDIPMTSDFMDEALYWKIIAESTKHTDRNEQYEYIKKRLKDLSPQEIIGFQLRTDKFMADTYTSELWCAGYVINGGCSDDGFDYFRGWIISRGKEVYYNAKDNPDSLINVSDLACDDCDFEEMLSLGRDAFEEKTGKELDDYVPGDVHSSMGYSEMQFNWEEDDEESMKRICPKLYAKFWDAWGEE